MNREELNAHLLEVAHSYMGAMSRIYDAGYRQALKDLGRAETPVLRTGEPVKRPETGQDCPVGPLSGAGAGIL